MSEMKRKRACSPYKNPEGKCGYCGSRICYQEKFCRHCGKENIGWIDAYDENQCGNCHAFMEPGDKYCRICGAMVGQGAFDPYQNLMECIYGPMPVERIHVCTRCKYRWSTCKMLDREKFCPQCGGFAPEEGYTPEEGGTPEKGYAERIANLFK